MIADAIYRTRLRTHTDRKLLIIMLGSSLILHSGLVILATAGLGFSTEKSRFAPVYSVELVSLPEAGAKKYPSFSKTPKGKTSRRTRGIPIQRFQPSEELLSLRKMQRAVVPKSETGEVKPAEETLTKIERRPQPQIEEEKKTEAVPHQPVASQKQVALLNIGGVEGGELSQALMLYRALVNEKIENNWVFPERLGTEKGKLEAVVVVRARRDGTLTDITFEKKSGNPHFDDSVLKAILKSKPFPPFPDIYSPQEEEIVIRFSPATVSS